MNADVFSCYVIYLLVGFDVYLIKHGNKHCDILCVQAIQLGMTCGVLL